MLALLLACTAPDTERPRYGDDTAADTADTAETGGETGETGEPEETGDSEDCTVCPCGMAPVGDPVAYCIDKYENDVDGTDFGNADQGADFPDGSTTGVPYSVAGVPPEIGISWYQAYALCENAGKHLCTPEEWRDGCDGVVGDGGSRWPWGEEPDPDQVCNAVSQDGTSQYTELALTGEFPECRTPSGVFDQSGNAWEWVDPGETGSDGLPKPGKVGGAYYSGQGSLQCGMEPMMDHTPDFSGTIGFRCCVEP